MMDINNNIIGIRIRLLREERELTLQALCDGVEKRFGAKIHKGTVSKWERNIAIPDLQSVILFVSDLAKNISPKTAANAYGLLIAAVTFYMHDANFRVTLPKRVKQKGVSPSDSDVAALFNSSNLNMQKAIALAAFGSLRRGEISALLYNDLSNNLIHVDKDMVQDENRKWIVKHMPKTSDGVRDILLPDEVIKLLGTGHEKDRIVPILPSSITKQFMQTRDKLNLNIRFHDLRHYYASIGAALNIPDTYISAFGGWRQGSIVLKQVYQNRIDDAYNSYAKLMNSHFDNVLNKCNTKCNTDNEKAAK